MGSRAASGGADPRSPDAQSPHLRLERALRVDLFRRSGAAVEEEFTFHSGPEGTVKSRLFGAHRRLRARLANCALELGYIERRNESLNVPALLAS